MSLRLDHFFVLTEPGAAAAAAIAELGLLEGPANSHPGQGSANRRFFCANTTLELLFLRDPAQSADRPAEGLQLSARWQQAEASPFGLIVRQDTQPAADAFAGWRYYPDYLDANQYFQVGENSSQLREPLCICMPTGLARPPRESIQNPDWQLTGLIVDVPVESPSAPLRAVADCEPIKLRPGRAHHLEVIFNHAQRNGKLDLGPELPLTIRY